MESWIKLHRKILQWEWWDNSDTLKVFLFLLLTGNSTDKLWHGVSLKRGQLVTSYLTVSQQTKIPYQTIRTIFERLKSTGEITVKTTNKYSIVTINNFNEYQPINRQTHSQSTVNQQSTNKQLTTAKEYIEVKNIKNNIESVHQKFLEEMKIKFPNHNVIEEWEKAKDWLSSTGRRYKDYQAFFRNWLRRADPIKQEVVEL